MIPKLVALLFSSGEPMVKKDLASLCNVEVSAIDDTLPELRKYLEAGGLALIESGNQIQIVTSREHSLLVTGFLKKDLEGELTPATLQVLTIISYLGTVTRADISFIRGVQSAQSIRTLTSRGLILRSGEQCSLTLDSLRHLGIEKVEDLPDYEVIHKDLATKLQEAKQEL